MYQDLSEKVDTKEKSKSLNSGLTVRYLICKCKRCKKLIYSFHLIEHSEICSGIKEMNLFKLSKKFRIQFQEIINDRILKFKLLNSIISTPNCKNFSIKQEKILKFYLKVSEKSWFEPYEIFKIQHRIFNSRLKFDFVKLEVTESYLKAKNSHFFQTSFLENQMMKKSYFLSTRGGRSQFYIVNIHKNFLLLKNNKYIVGMNIEDSSILFTLHINSKTTPQIYGDFEFLLFSENLTLTIWNIKNFFIEKQILIDGLSCNHIYLSFNQSHALLISQFQESCYSLNFVDMVSFELENNFVEMPKFWVELVVSKNKENIYIYNKSIYQYTSKYNKIVSIYDGLENIEYLCLTKNDKVIIFYSALMVKIFNKPRKTISFSFPIQPKDLIFCRVGLSLFVIEKNKVVDLNKIKNDFITNIDNILVTLPPDQKFTTSRSGFLGPCSKYFNQNLIINLIMYNKSTLGLSQDLTNQTITNYFNVSDRKLLKDFCVVLQKGEIEISSLKEMTNRSFKVSLEINFIGKISNSNTFVLGTRESFSLWKANESSPYFSLYDLRLPRNSSIFKCAEYKNFLIISSSQKFYIILKIKNMYKNYSLLENFSSVERITDNFIIYKKEETFIKFNSENKLVLQVKVEEPNYSFIQLDNDFVQITSKNKGMNIIDLGNGKRIFELNILSVNYYIVKVIKKYNIVIVIIYGFINIYDLKDGENFFTLSINNYIFSLTFEKIVLIRGSLIYFKLKKEAKYGLQFFDMKTNESGIVDLIDEDYLSLDIFEEFIIIRNNDGIFMYSSLKIDDVYKFPLNIREGYYVCIHKYIFIYNDKKLNFANVIDKSNHEIQRKTENRAKKSFWKEKKHHFLLIPNENLLIMYRGFDLFINIDVEIFDLSACDSVYNFSNSITEIKIEKIKNSIYIVEYDNELNVYVRQCNFIVKCSHCILNPPNHTNEIYLEGSIKEYESINKYSSSLRKVKLIELDDKLIVENTYKVFIYHIKSKTVLWKMSVPGLLSIKLSIDENILVFCDTQSMFKYDVTKREYLKFSIPFYIENLLFLSNDGSKAYVTAKYIKMILEIDLI